MSFISFLPVEVLALSFEWLPSITDLCSVRLVCRLWGGSDGDDEESPVSGVVRETLLSLNGEKYFATNHSPLFDHFGEQRPPFGSARSLRLYLCLCGDQLEQLSLKLGTRKGFKSLLHWLSSYSPNLNTLKISDGFDELPEWYGGTRATLPENFFLLGGVGAGKPPVDGESPTSAWYQLSCLQFLSSVSCHPQTLHWLSISAAAPSLQEVSLALADGQELNDLSFLKALPQLKSLSLLTSNTAARGFAAEGSQWYQEKDGSKGPVLIQRQVKHPLRGLKPTIRTLNWGFSPDGLFPLILPPNYYDGKVTRGKGGWARNLDTSYAKTPEQWGVPKFDDRPELLASLTSLTLRSDISKSVYTRLSNNCCNRLKSLNLIAAPPRDFGDFCAFLGELVSSADSSSLSQLEELRVGLWVTDFGTQEVSDNGWRFDRQKKEFKVRKSKDPFGKSMVDEQDRFMYVDQLIPRAFPHLKLLHIGSEKPRQASQANRWDGDRGLFFSPSPPGPQYHRRNATLNAIIRSVVDGCRKLDALLVPEQTRFSCIVEYLREKRLRVLGLYGIDLTKPIDFGTPLISPPTESDASAFSAFFKEEGRYLSSLEELNLSGIKWPSSGGESTSVGSGVIESIASRCDRLLKFYINSECACSSLFTSTSFGRSLVVLHIQVDTQNLEYYSFLDAVERQWLALTELHVFADRDSESSSVPSCFDGDEVTEDGLDGAREHQLRTLQSSGLFRDIRRRLKLCGRHTECQVTVGLIGDNSITTTSALPTLPSLEAPHEDPGPGNRPGDDWDTDEDEGDYYDEPYYDDYLT